MDEGGKGGDSSEGDGGGNEHGRQSERDEEGEEEAKCKAAIEVEKKVYKGSFQVRCHKCSSTKKHSMLPNARYFMSVPTAATRCAPNDDPPGGVLTRTPPTDTE